MAKHWTHDPEKLAAAIQKRRMTANQKKKSSKKPKTVKRKVTPKPNPHTPDPRDARAKEKRQVSLVVFSYQDGLTRDVHKCRSMLDAFSVVVEAYLMLGIAVEEVRITS